MLVKPLFFVFFSFAKINCCDRRAYRIMREIQLYDYQKDMVQRIEEAFKTRQSVMVQMPTGTGKTILLAEVVKSEKLKGKNPCVWIVVHRRELVEQIEETLAKQLDSSLFTLHLSKFSRYSGCRSTIMNWRRDLRLLSLMRRTMPWRRHIRR